MDLGNSLAEGAVVAITIKAIDEFSQTFDKAGGGLQGLGAMAEKAIMPAMAAIGAAMVKFGYDSVNAAADAEAEMAKFETTMKNTAGATEESRKAILDRSQALIKMGFDDEDSANSIAKLYQRTGDLNEAMNLNQLAMDLSRNKSISLGDATNAINLALSGNSRMLKQYGIDIKDTATPMEALNQVQEKVKGSAEAYSKTLKGQEETVKVMFTNIKEAVGDKLMPVIKEFMDTLMNKILPALSPIIDVFGDFAKIVLELVKNVLDGLMPAFNVIIPLIKNLFEILKPLLNSLADLGGAVGKLFSVVMERAGPFIKLFQDIFGSAMVTGLTIVVQAITAAVNILTTFFDIGNKIAKSMGLFDFFNQLGEGIKGIVEGIGNTVGKFINGIIDLINGFFQSSIVKGALSLVGVDTSTWKVSKVDWTSASSASSGMVGQNTTLGGTPSSGYTSPVSPVSPVSPASPATPTTPSGMIGGSTTTGNNPVTPTQTTNDRGNGFTSNNGVVTYTGTESRNDIVSTAYEDSFKIAQSAPNSGQSFTVNGVTYTAGKTLRKGGQDYILAIPAPVGANPGRVFTGAYGNWWTESVDGQNLIHPTQVGDFIMSPTGQLIQSSKNDWIIGTTDPSSMGIGGNTTVNIQNVYGVNPDQIVVAIQKKLNDKIRR